MNINKKGFTLIELLVVVAIIGVLATVVISNLSKSRTKAKDAAITLEMNQILTSVELETDALGIYTDVCDLFLPGGKLEQFKTSIEDYGGSWEDCEDDNVSYSILVTLNSGNYAFNLAQQAYAADAKITSSEKDGVHSSDDDKPTTFDKETLEKLRKIVGSKYEIEKPQFYCVGAKPAVTTGNGFIKGYMYDVNVNQFTGCGTLLEAKFDGDILLAAIENGLVKEVPVDEQIKAIIDQLRKLNEQIETTKDEKEKAALIETMEALEKELEALQSGK